MALQLAIRMVGGLEVEVWLELSLHWYSSEGMEGKVGEVREGESSMCWCGE